jgi:hypothetical protein
VFMADLGREAGEPRVGRAGLRASVWGVEEAPGQIPAITTRRFSASEASGVGLSDRHRLRAPRSLPARGFWTGVDQISASRTYMVVVTRGFGCPGRPATSACGPGYVTPCPVVSPFHQEFASMQESRRLLDANRRPGVPDVPRMQQWGDAVQSGTSVPIVPCTKLVQSNLYVRQRQLFDAAGHRLRCRRCGTDLSAGWFACSDVPGVLERRATPRSLRPRERREEDMQDVTVCFPRLIVDLLDPLEDPKA